MQETVEKNQTSPAPEKASEYKFPTFDKEVSSAELLRATKGYLEHIEKLPEAGGPFESGGISWDVHMPWNFPGTYYTGSLIKKIFGKEDVPVKKVTVTPKMAGCIPEIRIELEDGDTATLELKDGHVRCVVHGEDVEGKEYAVKVQFEEEEE